MSFLRKLFLLSESNQTKNPSNVNFEIFKFKPLKVNRETMGELPLLALVSLLDQLPLGDAVRYRRVSKQWRHLIDHSIYKRELVLFVECEPHPDWWEYSGEAINLKNSVRANFGAFESDSFFALFKGVRRLFLSFNHLTFSQELTDNLATFFGGTLEHLHVDFRSNSSVSHKETKFKLSLANLQTFYFAQATQYESRLRNFQFSLDCDRLTHLYTNGCLKVENDSNIVKIALNLRVLFVTEIIFRIDIKFPNLEIFGCSKKPDIELFTFYFPNLREFHYIHPASGHIVEPRYAIKSLLREIEEEEITLDVFWIGLRFTLENFDQIFKALEKHSVLGFTSNTLSYFKENVDAPDFKPICHTEDLVHYSDSFGDQLDELNRELVEKLAKCWRTVRIKYFKQPFDVAKLSDAFRFVNKLTVSRILKPSEFEALPVIFSNLQIFDLNSNSSEPVDLSFVSQFKNLYLFNTQLTPSSATVDHLITDCPHLYLLSFGSEKQITIRFRYRVHWQTQQRFQLIYKDEKVVFFLKSEEAILEFLFLNQYVKSE